jgi:tetratricopeptide (TPR) repeat protein
MRAEEALREALEVDPNSASAYSLLGDIRAARGQNQEAKQWYEMSVSVRPLGGDRQKLERLRRIEEQSAEPERTEALYGSRSWIRIAIYAAAALCLMLVVSALWILATQRANRSAVPVRPVARLAVSACHLRSGFALVGRPWYLLPT